MKFKLDENLDARLAEAMQKSDMDGDTVLGEELSGVSDEALFEVCKKTGRILITLDLDFANPLRFPPQSAPGIMVLRPRNYSLSQIRAILFDALPRLKEESIDGRLWIVEPGRVRVYSPEFEKE